MSQEFPYVINARRRDVDEWRRLLNDALIRGTPESPIVGQKGQHRSMLFDMRLLLANGARAGWIGEHLAWALSDAFFNARAIASSGIPGTLTAGVVVPPRTEESTQKPYS